MDFHSPSDSSGTDDDLAPSIPPNHINANRMTRGGRPSGNGRAAAASSYGRPQVGGAALAEQHTRRLEMEAYTAMVRAFVAQSENITWARDLLMSDIRKELRVTDIQHRELILKSVEEKDILQIREWRKMEATPDPNTPVALLEPSPSPAVSQSRKKAKPAHSAAATPILSNPPPPLLKPAPLSTPSAAPSPAVSKRNVPVGPRGKKTKGGRVPPPISVSTSKLLTGPPSSRTSSLGRGPPPTRAGMGSETPVENHIGRKVKTRWPEDNTFYEAVVTEYDQEKGLHALVYDMGTQQETWEWVNLKEMDTSDMKWVDAAPVVLPSRGSSSGVPAGRGSGRGSKKGGAGRGSSVSGVGRGRGAGRGQAAVSTPAVVPIAQTRTWRGSSANENGLEKKSSRTLQIPVVDPLLKEAENLKDITDLERLESMKRKAKAQGDALRTALAELGEESSEEGGSDGERGPSHMRLGERGNRSFQESRDRRDESDDEEDTAGDGRADGSDGELLGGEGVGSDTEQHMAEDGDEEDEDG